MSALYKYPCPENNISCFPIQLNLYPGKWKIELWGAGTNSGGGYTSGIISLSQNLILYAYLGGQEMPYGSECGFGGYNGGGNSSSTGLDSLSYCRHSGGNGASDVRLIEEELNSRIMVAGGAGGGSACSVVDLEHIGGYGGGVNAGDGIASIDFESSDYLQIGKGGTQYDGGLGKDKGKLGIGGMAQSTSMTDCAGAGGGGYYGGGSGYDYQYGASGGGGSSYISGYEYCTQHASEYIFNHAVMKSGNELMPQPEGNKKIGYIGQGAVRLTFISQSCLNIQGFFIISSRIFLKLTTIFILS